MHQGHVCWEKSVAEVSPKPHVTLHLSVPKTLLKINLKNSNPSISWHHLAWQIMKGGGYQFTSQQMCQRYTYLSPQMRVSVKWLAYLKCKWFERSIWFVLMPSQGAKCPQFENPDPGLIPVGYKTRISFEGINLDLYQVKWYRHRI